MADRQKTIKGMKSLHTRLLDAATRDKIATLDAMIVSDALALLKEQEPVVRCKDCICYDDEPGGTLKMCYYSLRWTSPDDYCSKGAQAKKMDGESDG